MVAGMNNIDIFPKRKSDSSLICDILIIFDKKQKKSRTSDKTLPGKGMGKNKEIISPITHIKKIITI